jgi:hypothetical protein
MGAADRIKQADIVSTIDPIMAEKGIPSWLWKSIAAKESGFNPGAMAVTDSEYSKGVFQINVKAHPEYIETDLTDPVVNATIARDVFIAPAYEYAKTITSDPVRQALIVYSGLKNPDRLETGAKAEYIPGGAGIRPKWTTATRDAFLGYVNEYRGAETVKTGSATGFADTTVTLPDGSNITVSTPTYGGSLTPPVAGTTGGGGIGFTDEGIKQLEDAGLIGGLSTAQGWARVGLMIAVVLVIIVAGFLLIGGSPQQIALNLATKGFAKNMTEGE